MRAKYKLIVNPPAAEKVEDSGSERMGCTCRMPENKR